VLVVSIGLEAATVGIVLVIFLSSAAAAAGTFAVESVVDDCDDPVISTAEAFDGLVENVVAGDGTDDDAAGAPTQSSYHTNCIAHRIFCMWKIPACCSLSRICRIFTLGTMMFSFLPLILSICFCRMIQATSRSQSLSKSSSKDNSNNELFLCLQCSVYFKPTF
jgi:hypothetical protein